MLKKLLLEKKSSVLKKWFNSVVDTYPTDTRRFLKEQKDQFANPVGSTISRELESLLEELLQGMDSKKVSQFLDNVIRIRAIQDFTPSEAIGFIFSLKKVIREELGDEIRESGLYKELLELESEIDKLGLLAFDIYMQCREKTYEIKVNELNNRIRGPMQGRKSQRIEKP